MIIFDCFMYCGEDTVLDVRLNYLEQYVDKFVIVESNYTHSGNKKKFLFKISKFKKFKKKINYLKIYKQPSDLILEKSKKYNLNSIKILNAIKRENFQRNFIMKGLTNAKCDDIIILSDIDEIPKLEKFNFNKVTNSIYFFNQYYFYYKFNLYDPKRSWHGSRLCKFSELKSPQWLRNLKAKKFSYFRLDALFNSKKRFNNIFLEDGGWHFSYLNNSEGIKKKLSQYLHHVDYELNPLSLKQISNIIQNKKAIYNLNLDQRSSNRFKSGNRLKKYDLKKLPFYLIKNKKKFKKWFL